MKGRMMGEIEDFVARMNERSAEMGEHFKQFKKEEKGAKCAAHRMAVLFLGMIDDCPEGLAAKLQSEGLTQEAWLDKSFGPLSDLCGEHREALFAAVRAGMTVEEYLAADSAAAWLLEHQGPKP